MNRDTKQKLRAERATRETERRRYEDKATANAERARRLASGPSFIDKQRKNRR